MASGQRRIKLGAVSPTRDFNYVADTVAGFVAAIDAPAAVGQVINLGSGYEVSIGDTARTIAELMSVQVEIDVDAERLRPEASEVDRLLASNDLARRLLGWAPRYAGLVGLRRGLAETIAWLEQPANLAGYKVERYNV